MWGKKIAEGFIESLIYESFESWKFFFIVTYLKWGGGEKENAIKRRKRVKEI